jgi:hypothetical protein
MKNIVISGLTLLLILNISCSKDTLNLPAEKIPNDLLVGKWIVSSYFDENIDCTNQFAGYTFICSADGSMTIDGNGQSYICDWSMDGTNSMCDLNINGCGDNSYLGQLNYGWEVTNFDDQNCYFMNNEQHENCSSMMSHERIMVWTKI